MISNADIVETIELTAKLLELHNDENNNTKLDAGMFGIPKEPWGMSNNVKATFGPPKFEESLIDLKTNKEISIILH